MAAKIQNKQLLSWLENHIAVNEVVLDIGCGNKWYWPALRKHNIVMQGVDAFKPFKPDFLMDIEKQEWPFKDRSYDIVLMLDVIEHLDKERGKEILYRAECTARRAVIVLTPLEWSNNIHNTINPRDEYYGNRHNIHKSLWDENDFQGYEKADQLNLVKSGKYYIGINHLV